MAKLSEKYPVLKRYNKKLSLSNRRNIRVGVLVSTTKGLGIVTWRKGSAIEVAVRPDRVGEIMSCYRYNFDVKEVELTNEKISDDDRLYEGAWYWIFNYARLDNQSFESDKQRAIFEMYESVVPGKRVERTISCGQWGSAKYRRYTGVNKKGQAFDFELSTNPYLAFPYGDRILYAMGENNGYIYDMNGHGRLYQRKIEDSDINYGIAKYAGPQEEDAE